MSFNVGKSYSVLSRPSPPSRKHKVGQGPRTEAVYSTSEATVETRRDGFVTTTLKALAGLAAVATPVGAAQAQESFHAVESVGEDNLRLGARREEDVSAVSVADESISGELSSGLEFRFEPYDFGVSPRWNSGSPTLRFRADLAELSVSKQYLSDGGWDAAWGMGTKFRAETYLGEELNLSWSANAYRHRQRPLGDGYSLRLEEAAQFTYNLVSDDPGAIFSVGFRQEIEGGSFSFWDRDFSFYGETTQNVGYDFRSDEPFGRYTLFAGARTDFDLNLLGRRADVELTVGPKLEGDLFGDPSPRLKLGTEFRIDLP